MAIDFRLSYRTALGYTDLFPQTSVQEIIGADEIYQLVPLDVTIPPVSQQTQTISIVTDAFMPTSDFKVYLNTAGEQAMEDWCTINQMQVTENTLTITRLYSYPTGSIDVTLVFIEKRGAI